MASVYNNPSSQDWYASFKNADGKWVARSTKTTKKDDALCIAHERKR